MTAQKETVKLLMVDDESILYHGVHRVLENFRVLLPDIDTEVEFEMTWVGTGEEGLEAIESLSPDLIFLDYKLPGISGLDVLDELRKKQLDPLVVMVTAFASLETAVKATKLGAFDFLSKPFSPDEIRYVAKKAVSQIVLSRRAKSLQEDKKRIRFEFLSVLAHELKAPINAIDGYLDILKDRLSGQELMMVERSHIRLDGMRRLIFDLLDLTRIESGQRKRDFTSVDLIKVITTAIENEQIEAQRRNIDISPPNDNSFFVHADLGEMEIICNNLISNAVKYNRDGGKVSIRLSRNQGTIQLSVSDTGVGLSQSDIEKLFKEFSRVRNERTAQVIGSGLGLSTLKKLVTLYNGDVLVESKENEGSTFTALFRDTREVRT
jgi:two-component system sensor histidine kinase/response regulator